MALLRYDTKMEFAIFIAKKPNKFSKHEQYVYVLY